MSKNKNLIIAEKSLEIIQNGKFRMGENEIFVKDKIERSVALTSTKSPEELARLTNQDLPLAVFETQIEVLNLSTIQALVQENSLLKTAVLNFASAKNPGGGFLGGAVAQEESLARSSSLYASLTKDLTMYKYNRANSTFLYSDYMIYSPEVIFWMDDEGMFLQKPVQVDVITAPAPNKGAMLHSKRHYEIEVIEETFKVRIDKLFALALSEKVACLILGAWGCGVFQNDPNSVANYFKEALETKYKNQFKRVVFAIYGRKNENTMKIFNDAFKM